MIEDDPKDEAWDLHAHRAPVRSTKWTSIDDALAEFLVTPCSPPGELFFGDGAWTNEGLITHQQGSQGIHATNPALFDAVRSKYEAPEVATFEQAFRALATACGRDWAKFDLACLRECCDAFAAFELPLWVAEELDRNPDSFLVNKKPALFMSVDMTWCSPKAVLDRVRRMGPIGLDPCSNGKSIVRAKTEWRGPPAVDGLAEPWIGHGLVYVNPPYGRVINQWVAKCALEAMDGAEILALVPARPDTIWWSEAVVAHASSICFWKGRVTFLGASQGAPFPSAVLYYGARVAEFVAAFGDVGWCVDPKALDQFLRPERLL